MEDYRKDYNWKESIIRVQLCLSGRRGNFEDFLEFSVLYVCPFQFVSDGCQVWIYSVFFCKLYWWLCSSNHFCDSYFEILSRILVSCYWCEVSSSRIVNWIFFIYVEELLAFKYSSLRYELLHRVLTFFIRLIWFFSAISFDICTQYLA